jgi:thiosulfate dehydrogenase [quinone] large subunit
MSTESHECTESKCCDSETKPSSCCGGGKLGHIYASWILRGWLGVRAVLTGIEKYAGTGMSDGAVPVDGVPNEQGLTSAISFKEYGLAHYHGVPSGLYEEFTKEPLMPKMMLPIYDKVLGPALIVLGLAILLGFFYRTSLFFLGLLYISLTLGLILLKQDPGIAWLGTHMVIIAMALMLAEHNRLSILKKW